LHGSGGLVVVRTSQHPANTDYPPACRVVDINQLTDHEVVRVLAGHIDPALAVRPDVPRSTDGPVRPRADTSGPRVTNSPTRNPQFVGRQGLLEELRERLNGTDLSQRHQVLHGAGGVGKSQLAIEYMHRFANDYDIIWWVSADEATLIQVSLGLLADRLDLDGSGGFTASVEVVLAELASGRTSQHWLIVFDHVEDLDKLHCYLPTGPGHVLITTKGPAPSDRPGIAVPPFTRDESITLLNILVPGVAASERRKLAMELGDIPGALVHAADLLTPRSNRGGKLRAPRSRR
jgi:hypothetical protein